METERFLADYYENDAEKLRGMVDRILLRFGGISEMDRDDFYSVANEVMAQIYVSFDASRSPDGYVYSCLLKRMKTEMTRRNREKRRAEQTAVSLDTPVGEESTMTVGDTLVSEFDLYREVFREDEQMGAKAKAYLDRLSKTQRRIAVFLAEGYKPVEIQNMLHMKPGEYSSQMAALHAYENIKILL
ncbi:MAG: hypothetical protein J5986_11275 [Roseburia sp.]|nr:hypothetical protein [Roseburia sp.]